MDDLQEPGLGIRNRCSDLFVWAPVEVKDPGGIVFTSVDGACQRFHGDAYKFAYMAELSAHLLIRNAVSANAGQTIMNGIIYLVGLVVVILAILSFFGLH